jgi:hypothetical protein
MPDGLKRHAPFIWVLKSTYEDHRLDASDVAVWFALAYHADSDGVCWPARETLRRRARIGQDALVVSLRKLIDLGYLKKEPQFDEKGRQTSNLYTMLERGEGAVSVHPPPGSSTGEGTVSVHRTRFNEQASSPFSPREEGDEEKVKDISGKVPWRKKRRAS